MRAFVCARVEVGDVVNRKEEPHQKRWNAADSLSSFRQQITLQNGTKEIEIIFTLWIMRTINFILSIRRLAVSSVLLHFVDFAAAACHSFLQVCLVIFPSTLKQYSVESWCYFSAWLLLLLVFATIDALFFLVCDMIRSEWGKTNSSLRWAVTWNDAHTQTPAMANSSH